MYDNVVNDFGYIDVVVNCAGIMNDRPNAYVKEIEINVVSKTGHLSCTLLEIQMTFFDEFFYVFTDCFNKEFV